MATVRADDQRRGVTGRKTLRAHKDPVIGRAVLREIDRRLGRRRSARDRHQLRRRAGFAGPALGIVDIVDHGEISGLGAVGYLHPYRREAGIVGEADVKLGLPGAVASCTAVPDISMQGRGPGNNSPRANTAATASGTTEANIFKRNMTLLA